MPQLKSGIWSESELLNLPHGENDSFDRKSGSILSVQDFRTALAKQLSAFANSGGGHLFIGVRDDGTLDGVPIRRIVSGGRDQDTREWLEQIIPPLLDYPLQGFSVDHFIPDAVAPVLPADKTVLVINIPDSPLAPHQCVHNRMYYCRQSGHSNPAPHNLIDLLRHRPSAATLSASVKTFALWEPNALHWDGRNWDHPTANFGIDFEVTNLSRTVAATHWGVYLEHFINAAPNRENDYHGAGAIFPPQNTEPVAPLLPSGSGICRKVIGLRLRVGTRHWECVLPELQLLMPPNFGLRFRAVSDSWAGNDTTVTLALPDMHEVAQNIATLWDRKVNQQAIR
jgi:hypothetical protein